MDNEQFATELAGAAATMLTAANRMKEAAKLTDESNAALMEFMSGWLEQVVGTLEKK